LANTDWDYPPWREADLEKMSNIENARIEYEVLIARLVQFSQLEVSFRWDRGWNLDMGAHYYVYSNLPAILTAQLMLRVSAAKTYIKCSECPRWFFPRRNQRKYCNSCGKRAMWRVAQRKRRGK
jgi:hypothetical protein